MASISKRRRARVPLLVGAACVIVSCGPDRDWHLTASVTGPTRPLPDQTLTLTIESSESPAVKIKSPAGERYWGCRGPWIGGKLECTLPPGVSLDSVVTTGHCADFSCGNDASACPPPAKRFARVTAESVPFWSVTPRQEARLRMSSPRTTGGITTLPQIEVTIDVGEAESEVRLRAETEDGKPFPLHSGDTAPEQCFHQGEATHRPARQAVCAFQSLHDVKAPTALRLIAEATIFGRCPRGVPSCTPPAPIPTIVSISLTE